jgi:hypothetical protein
MPGIGGGKGGTPGKAPGGGGMPGKAGGAPGGMTDTGGTGMGGVGAGAYVWGVAAYTALWFVSAGAGAGVSWAPMRALCASS